MGRDMRMKKNTDRGVLGDFALGRLSPEESLKLLDEIENDPEASRQLELVTELMNVVDSHGAEVFEGRIPVGMVSTRWSNLGAGLMRFFKARKFAMATVTGALCVAAASVVIVSHLTSPGYFALAKVDGADYITRVRGLDDFADAHALLDAGETELAIKSLERYTRAFPDGPRVDYAHYLAGAALLISAHRGFLTLFPSFDHERVVAAMRHLELAAHRSANPRVKEESHWLIAKAHLMLEKPDDAIAQLQLVITLDGVRKTGASALLEDLQKAR